MDRQLFLHELFGGKCEGKKVYNELKMLNWNIRNPSVSRAKEQVDWIIKADADIVILTEAKYSEGCIYIRDWLESFGFRVLLPIPKENDYCVLIGAKGCDFESFDLGLRFLSHRLSCISCDTILGKIRVIGTYVPSRGPIERRNVDKQGFQSEVVRIFETLSKKEGTENLVVAGDLNVVERNHVPHYNVFGEWEYSFYESFLKSGLVDGYRFLHPIDQDYSWFGKYGDGYRFDHFFISKNLLKYIAECDYIHSPRISKLGDHPAMYLKMVLNPEEKTIKRQ